MHLIDICRPDLTALRVAINFNERHKKKRQQGGRPGGVTGTQKRGCLKMDADADCDPG